MWESDGVTYKLFLDDNEETLSGTNNGDWFGDSTNTLTHSTIGVLRRNVLIDPVVNGIIGIHVIWNVILTALEKSALDHGVIAFVIRNQSLEQLVIIYGNISPERDYSKNLENHTVTGTVKATEHPPMQLLSRYMSGH